MHLARTSPGLSGHRILQYSLGSSPIYEEYLIVDRNRKADLIQMISGTGEQSESSGSQPIWRAAETARE
jgi:hypothetical protein